MKSARLKSIVGAAALTLALAACAADEEPDAVAEDAPAEEQTTDAAGAGAPGPEATEAEPAAPGEAPDDVAVTFLSLVADGDCAAAEQLAHGEGEEDFTEGCTGLHEQFSGMTFDPTVDELTEDGDTATVTITIDGLSEDIVMTRVDGEWKVDLEYGY